MLHVIPRRLIAMATLLAAGGALGSTVVATSGARTDAGAAAVPTPPQTITATRITRPSRTLKPGTKVAASRIGARVFTDRRHGFALVAIGSAQYPAATADAGASWHTDGPALHLNAAQAPLAVSDVGAINRRVLYAFGGGQVVDATGDGGAHWWRAFLGDEVVAVVPGFGHDLLAFAEAAASTGSSHVVIWQYVSKDGGHHWRYSTTFAGS
jgi:hypothetical protein